MSRSGTTRKWPIAVIWLWTLWLGVLPYAPCGAQIKIIPQEMLDKAAAPEKVEAVGVSIEGGTTIDLGTIAEDAEPRKVTFEWHNGSGRAAAVTQIRTGCGCVVADYDKRPVESAHNGKVELSFNPKGRSGKVSYKVWLYTTLSDKGPSAMVEIVGEVHTSHSSTPQWPHSMGTLLLRSKRVVMEGGKGRIAVRNGGSTPLTVMHDSRLSSKGIVAYTEPRVIEPNCEGDLVIEWQQTEGGNAPRLYLQGVNCPPRERHIVVE